MDSHVPLGRRRSSSGRRRENAVKACYVATEPVVEKNGTEQNLKNDNPSRLYPQKEEYDTSRQTDFGALQTDKQTDPNRQLQTDSSQQTAPNRQLQADSSKQTALP